jgi:hypothetical protein
MRQARLPFPHQAALLRFSVARRGGAESRAETEKKPNRKPGKEFSV